jgi:hypothetical protein
MGIILGPEKAVPAAPVALAEGELEPPWEALVERVALAVVVPMAFQDRVHKCQFFMAVAWRDLEGKVEVPAKLWAISMLWEPSMSRRLQVHRGKPERVAVTGGRIRCQQIITWRRGMNLHVVAAAAVAAVEPVLRQTRPLAAVGPPVAVAAVAAAVPFTARNIVAVMQEKMHTEEVVPAETQVDKRARLLRPAHFIRVSKKMANGMLAPKEQLLAVQAVRLARQASRADWVRCGWHQRRTSMWRERHRPPRPIRLPSTP